MGQRVGAIILAVVFLVSSMAFSGFVIWQMIKENKNKPSSSQTSSETASSNNSATNKEGKLEGTKLAGFQPIAKVDKLTKIDTKVGTGDEVKPGDTVTAHYTGAVASTGIIFHSLYDSGSPVPFGLDHVIKGWTEGVPGMRVGGKRRLLIPAAQAYGANPPQGIPANADLVFDIDLVKIGK